MEAGLIRSLPDVFRLKEEDFLTLELFKEKRAGNLIKSLDLVKTITLDRFIYSLGIRYMGETSSYDLARHLVQKNGSKAEISVRELLQILQNLSLEEINSIEGIGEKIATTLYSWIQNSRNQQLLEDFEQVGIKLDTTGFSSNGELSGKSFVITGTLESMGREQAKSIIKSKGGKVLSDVSKDTDYLVVGESPGSKLAKANKLGVKILNEGGFMDLVK